MRFNGNTEAAMGCAEPQTFALNRNQVARRSRAVQFDVEQPNRLPAILARTVEPYDPIRRGRHGSGEPCYEELARTDHMPHPPPGIRGLAWVMSSNRFAVAQDAQQQNTHVADSFLQEAGWKTPSSKPANLRGRKKKGPPRRMALDSHGPSKWTPYAAARRRRINPTRPMPPRLKRATRVEGSGTGGA